MQDILDKLRADFEVRIVAMERYLKGNVLSKVAALSGQDCYMVFGESNDSLESLDRLNSMIINGLDDDSQLGVINNEHQLWKVDYVDEDYEYCLSEEQLLNLIAEAPKASTYYAANSEAIESRCKAPYYSDESKEYSRLSREYTLLLRSYMQPCDRKELEDKEASGRERMRKRIAARKPN